MWAILQQAAMTAALLWRASDLGPNAAALLTWIAVGNAAVIAAAISSKALEQYLIAKAAARPAA